MVSIQIAALMLAATGAGETILYDFQAEWCGPCKMMDPVVQQLAAQGYPVRKVDVDRDRALAQQYRVSNIPCFVLVVNGQERGRVVGATGYGQLAGLFQAAGVNPAGAGVRNSRGQSPDKPRRLLTLPRVFGSRAAPAASGPRPPRVDLGQPTAAPFAQTAPAVPAPPIAPTVDFASTPTGHGTPAGTPRAMTLSQRLLQSSVRLKIQDPGGFSFGSGTIIDYRPSSSGQGGEALILTCAHIFRDSKGQGAIQVDLFDRGRSETVSGRMVRYDLQSDVGLVAVPTSRPVPVVPLASADQKPARGEDVISIGCDHGRDPTVLESNVTAINSFVGPANVQVAGQPAVGRSGGGLFNRQGKLIGICNFADPTDQAGLYAAVELAHLILKQSGLDGEMLASGGAADGAPGAARDITDLVELVGSTSTAGSAPELICIVRSGKGTGSRHQVIVIDNVSQDLLQRIADERQRGQGAYPTSMAVSDGKVIPAGYERGVIRTTTDWQPKWR